MPQTRLPIVFLAASAALGLISTACSPSSEQAVATENAAQKDAQKDDAKKDARKDAAKPGQAGQRPGGQGRPGGRGPGGGPPGEPGAQEGVLVKLAAVRVEPMASLYSTSATLRASQRATVTARTRGVVERLVVEEGDRVRSGDPLAYLEDDEQTIAVERTKATLETRKWEFERTKNLFEQALVSEEAYEQARREIRDAQQAADLAELELSRTVIRAPFGGVVITRHLDVGNTLSDGQPVYTLADVATLLADVNVPERHVARLAAGQTVRLLADATGEKVDAVIERIAPSVDAGTGTVKVTVAVAGSETLRPGSFVRVDVVTDTHPEALVVPRSALVAEGRRWTLYRVADGAKTAEQVEVAVGFEDGDRVEVLPLPEGPVIAEGERVVVAGVGALSDGAPVEIQDGDAATGDVDT